MLLSHPKVFQEVDNESRDGGTPRLLRGPLAGPRARDASGCARPRSHLPPAPATTLRAIRYPVWSKAPPTSGPPGLHAGPTSSSRPSRHPVGPTCAASDRSSARSVHLGRHFGRILYFVRRRSS